jgi:ubiquinone/menaquinone biosynthesis C-methylase UbiE
MDEIKDIEQYYENYDEEGRLERNQLEQEITLKFLKDFLPSSGQVLELGAATGKYTLSLAQSGYSIHAVDLSVALIEKAKGRLSSLQNHKVTFEARDASDLSHLAANTFDAILVMGPLYHLVDKKEREDLLKSCYRLLKPNGVLISTHCTRLGMLGHMLNKYPDWIGEQDEIKAIISKGFDANHGRKGNFRAYFVRPEDVCVEHEAAGFASKVLAGLEPAIGPADEYFNRLQGENRDQWVNLLYSLSTEPSWLGASRHLIYIGHKK